MFRRLVECSIVGLALLSGCGGDDREHTPTRAETQATTGVERPSEPRVETVAEGLEVPWEIAFLPDGRALITERPGRVKLLDTQETLADVAVANVGEGGLLGLAVDPEFEDNGFVYLYRTVEDGNEVARYRLEGDRLEEEATIVTGIAAAPIHDGGRLRFGPDGDLYITTGDASHPELSQDPESLNGKVLRLAAARAREDGGRPEVFTLGHRNPQGLDWQPGTERLYEAEHGPSGEDEMNLLNEGSNYGWPEVTGSEHGDFAAPLAVYTPSIAPSGATFVRTEGSAWTGDFLVACLAGEQIRRLRFDGDAVELDEPLFEGEYGRLRSVVEGPDGFLYALTNNTDGRGSPREGDDRVLRIEPPAG
ncbi:MAG: PQQ-dependent sugar dehydrogenase [Thermoleophilaceae bacterium]